MNTKSIYLTIVVFAVCANQDAFAMAKLRKTHGARPNSAQASPAQASAPLPSAPLQSATVTAPQAAVDAPVATPTYTAQPAYSDGTFDFEALKKILKDNKNIKSVDDVIPLLPDSYKNNFVVSYKSRSRQGGIPESPRVIAFGAPLAGDRQYPYSDTSPSRSNDNLLIAFKSDPSLKYGPIPDEDDLEVFEWIPGKKNWIARDITFPNRKSDRADLSDDERFNISADNPKECQYCHRYPEMRPNWESYPRWPGFFGSNANEYGNDVEKQTSIEEHAALKLFGQKIKDLPRFKMLAPFPYDEAYNGGARERENINIRMTVKVGRLNFRRIQRIIEGNPEYPKLRYAVYAGLGHCADFPSFLSDSLRSKITLNYDDLYKETQAAMDRPEFHFIIGGRSDYDLKTLDREVRAMTNMRYLFEGGLGQSIDPWFMNVDRDQFRANAVGGNIATDVGGELTSGFYREAKYNDFKLNLYTIDDQPASNCSVLRDLSLQTQGREK